MAGRTDAAPPPEGEGKQRRFWETIQVVVRLETWQSRVKERADRDTTGCGRRAEDRFPHLK